MSRVEARSEKEKKKKGVQGRLALSYITWADDARAAEPTNTQEKGCFSDGKLPARPVGAARLAEHENPPPQRGAEKRGKKEVFLKN